MKSVKLQALVIAALFTPVICAAILYTPALAEDIEIEPGTKLEKIVNVNSYEYDKNADHITFYNKAFDGPIYMTKGGHNDNSHLYGATAMMTCETNRNSSAQYTMKIYVTNSEESLDSYERFKSELASGKKPVLNVYMYSDLYTPNLVHTDDQEALDKACTDKWSGASSGPTTTKTEDRQIVANRLFKNETWSAQEQAFGEKLASSSRGLLDSFRPDKLADEVKLAEGCATIGGSISCDKTAREKLFKRSLGICWRRADTVVLNRTFGDTSEQATKDIYRECIKPFFPEDERTTSEITRSIKEIKRSDMRKIAEEAKNKTRKDLNTPTTPTTPTDSAQEEKPTCASQGLVAAWVLCPLLDGAIKLADWSWSLFEVMLAHNPIRQYKLDDQGKPTTEETGYYTTWSYVRNIANVALVLLFLFVIYSQITGYGISNYGIKQSLPRIIVIAILINVSFFLIQITFDVASVIGATMNDMIAGQVKAIPSLENLSGDIIKTGALGLSGGAIALGAVAVAGPSTAMLFFTLLILPGVVALIAGFFTVLMRNALLPIVAVLGPLALVAYVLPNTASLFEKWKKTFTSLLFLYPTAALYYAALKAAAIMMIGDEDPDATLQRLMGFALLLFGSGFIVILAIKSNAITGKIMGGAQGILSRMASPIEKIGRDTMSAMALDKMGAFRSQDFGNKSRWNPKRYIGKSMQSFDRRARDRKLRTALRSSEADQQYNQGVLADTSRLGGLDKTIGGQAYINKLQSDAVANKEISLRNEDINSLGRILENAIKSGDAVSARAAQKSLLGSGAPGIQKLQNTLSAVENSGIGQDNSIMSSLRQDINSAGIKGKDAVLATWGYQNGKTIDQVRSDANTYSGLNAIEAAGQSVENLTAGVASGGITADIVKRIDSSDAAQSILTGKKSGILEPLREK